jgi:hypothetical protein
MPAGFGPRSPGIGELIEGAVQQAAQPGRHSIALLLSLHFGELMTAMVTRRHDSIEKHSKWSRPWPSLPRLASGLGATR